jgi:RNA processing factor Prp31
METKSTISFVKSELTLMFPFSQKHHNIITLTHQHINTSTHQPNNTTTQQHNKLKKYVSNKICEDIDNYKLGLSHSMSTKKLKFSPEKVDLMIIQAICSTKLKITPKLKLKPNLILNLKALLDDIDKKLNTHLMRIKEWVTFQTDFLPLN